MKRELIYRTDAMAAVGNLTDLSEADRTKAMQAVLGVPSAQPERKWIPCSERLPNEHGWYICAIKDGRVNSLYYANRLGWVDNVRKYMFELYDIHSKLTGKEIKPEHEAVDWNGWVKAWMPLPEPYKEEKE